MAESFIHVELRKRVARVLPKCDVINIIRSLPFLFIYFLFEKKLIFFSQSGEEAARTAVYNVFVYDKTAGIIIGCVSD